MIRIVIRFIYIVIFATFLLMSLFTTETEAKSANIEVLKVQGTIVPVVADYIKRGINDAEDRGSTVCIIELDTPGGLLDSTEDIVQHILNARVPIVVYVSPSGSWAASAGTFITIAANIAVMAPGTTIGAAHPVSVGEEIPEDVQKKATEYASAWIRSIADSRGRDPQQAELAVRESKSFTVTEALENNLIDFQADSLDNLIEQINGMEVTLADGRVITIDTSGDSLTRNEMNTAENLLHVISDPNIAYILLSLATIGLITEISNPGLIFPGVIGGISLLIAFYSLGTLNAYWVGILLMVLAFVLFIAEIFTTTFGILTAGGLTSLIIGSLVLFSNNPPVLEVNRGLIAVVSIVVAAFTVFVIGAVIRGQRRKTITGSEGLVGKVGVVDKKLSPKGKVLVNGERWDANVDKGEVDIGQEVIITKVDGLKLVVSKKKE
jgi:membrane-bound serine protease (ClpP class)